MIDAPPAIVQQAPNHVRDQVLTEYARYFYGNDVRIRHTPERLEQFAIYARQHNLLTIAEYFDLLAERAAWEDEQEYLHSIAEAVAHRNYLANDYC